MLSSRESAAPSEYPTVVTDEVPDLSITSFTADRTCNAVLWNERGG